MSLIEVRNLTAKYNEKIILDNISITIYPNEITVILGTSGSGKTTFLKNITRLIEPFSGSVHIFGENITAMDELQYTQILKKIGMLFQNGALLNSISVYENIAIPLEQHSNLSSDIIDIIIKKKLELVGLSNAINLLPSELSGGMKKRAALARAIALDPQILFFDEPSAGLDPITSENLDDLIITLKNLLNISLIIVTHEIASINRIADRVIFFDKGKIVFHGKLNDVIYSNSEIVRKFFGIL